MLNAAGGPVYYGTPESVRRAEAGLARVEAVYGRNSPQYRAAKRAAEGVYEAFIQGNYYNDPAYYGA